MLDMVREWVDKYFCEYKISNASSHLFALPIPIAVDHDDGNGSFCIEMTFRDHGQHFSVSAPGSICGIELMYADPKMFVKLWDYLEATIPRITMENMAGEWAKRLVHPAGALPNFQYTQFGLGGK